MIHFQSISLLAAERVENSGARLLKFFTFCSPILAFVFNLLESRQCDFAIRWKRCGENIPAPVGTMPDSWIVARCPLCGEIRHYLPSEIFRGKLSYKLASKRPRSVVP